MKLRMDPSPHPHTTHDGVKGVQLHLLNSYKMNFQNEF